MISSTNNVIYSTETPTTEEYLEASGVDVTAVLKILLDAKLNPNYVEIGEAHRIKLNKIMDNVLDIMIDVTDTGGAEPFNE